MSPAPTNPSVTAPPLEREPSPAAALLRPGNTCWRVERANRFAIIVDAADYFAQVRAAILKARHVVMLIGWDFDTRIKLEPERETPDSPERLGEFMQWIVKEKPDLRAYVLKWDLGTLETLARGTTPLFVLDWMTSKRIRFKLDGAHPVGACHHQKIVVIDDAVAFCGGIDMTSNRWDTREHRDDDPRRIMPNGSPYEPWHDATATVDGPAAEALGELCRLRWEHATGERLPPAPRGGDPWPEGLRPTLENVDVGIARTAPAHADRPEIREIEALYLAAIASARRTIYMESQYFASRRIGDAVAARLSEDDPPEIVLVNPESTRGWLEEEAMGSARARILRHIQSSDRHGRFAIYYPVTDGGTPIYVHAKVMIVDDWYLKIGSSNFNNRSMGYDTECDLAVEALPGQRNAAETSAAILSFRNDLLAEHLGRTPHEVERAIEAASGSLLRAIEALRGPGRSLVPLKPPDTNAVEDLLTENELLDPERPRSMWPSLKQGWRYLPAALVASLRGASRRPAQPK